MKNVRWSELLNPLTFRNRTAITAFDGRNPFESDYGRLISSSPIRRLQDKTQVFPLEQSDFIRTRLTHSLEVSYIGSSIGTSIEKFLIENEYLDKKYLGFLSSLLRVSGLVHDLGNPPFGHFGEEAIKKYFLDYFEGNPNIGLNELEKSDFKNFDGNVQAFRILRKLHYFGDEFSFNLTYPSLASIIKYPSNSIDGNLGKKSMEIRKKKFGYFITEKNDYYEINAKLKLNNKRHPIVYLLEAADDIAYCAADIEDGIKLGTINLDDIKKIFEDFLNANADLNIELESLCNTIQADKGDKAIVVVQRFRVLAQGRMIKEIISSFQENYDLIMGGNLEKEIIEISKASDIRKAFKELQYIVFDNKKIMQAELAGWEAIYGLLGIFIPAILNEKFNPSENSRESRLYKNISSSYRYYYENFSTKYHSNDIYNRIQLVVDFISGMTDSYAISLFQKLKGIKI
jgi:dGTPase